MQKSSVGHGHHCNVHVHVCARVSEREALTELALAALHFRFVVPVYRERVLYRAITEPTYIQHEYSRIL